MPASSLRVALFTGNYGYTPDGAAKTLTRLVGHLRGRGARVRIYSPTDRRQPAAEQLVPVPSVSLPFRPEYRLGLGLTPALREDVVAFAPEIVHLSTPDLLGFQVQRLAGQLGAPVVGSLHTRFETYLAYYGLGWLEPVVEQTIRRFYLGCDRVLVPNPDLARQMSAWGLEGRVGVWSRGVDRELFDPARRDLGWRRAQGFADEDVVVLFFGRLVLEKGLPVFVEAAQRLAAKVLIVGDGPARDWLRERLPAAVFAGHLSGEALARAVASADVLFNPSLTETFGNVTLEAMASGLAVVCADLPNSRAMVRHEANGLLCRPEGADGFVEALGQLMADPALRSGLGRAAREASANFSWDVELSGVAIVYEELLATRRAIAALRAAA